jgi:hypothetical protein
VRTVREPLNVIINWLVWLGITCHERCIAAAVGLPVSLRVVVPIPDQPARCASVRADCADTACGGAGRAGAGANGAV